MKQYLFNIAISFDQFCNALTGGSPDETLSSRLGRYSTEEPDGFWSRVGLGVCRIVVAFLDIIQWNHCANAIEPADRHEVDILK